MRRAFLFALTALAAYASAGTKVVIGRLGRSTMAAQIYVAPSAKARVVARVSPGASLVVRNDGGKWLTVVMQNGQLCYIPTQSVEILQYEVTADRPSEVPYRATPRPSYLASRGGAPRGSDANRQALAAYATQFEGTTPYKWGGNEIGSGIDCSGFVKKMYGQIGVSLPRTAAEQANVGQPILNYQDLLPGDRLYFWDAKKGKIGHTGIYVGNGYFTHSSSGHHGIARDYLSDRWKRICVAARR